MSRKQIVWLVLYVILTWIVLRSWGEILPFLEKILVAYFPWNILLLILTVGIFTGIYFFWKGQGRQLLRNWWPPRTVTNSGGTTTITPVTREEKIEKIVIIAVSGILLIVITIISIFITVALLGDPVAAPEAPLQAPELETPIEDPHEWRAGLGLFLIVLVLIVFWRYSLYERRSEKRWPEILIEPMFIVVYSLIAFWLTVAFLIPILWEWIWADQILFWSINLGIITVAFFRSLRDADGKPVPHAQSAGNFLAIVLVIGIVTQITRHPSLRDHEWEWPWFGRSVDRQALVISKFPTEIELPIICGCESGNGVPPGKHFDDKKKVIVNVNDPNDPTNVDVGACQINLKYQAVIIKKTELDPYKEADNRLLASMIHEEQGRAPWNASRSCWESKLATLVNKGFEVKVSAPSKSAPPQKKWSEPKPVPGNFMVNWSSPTSFKVRNDLGRETVYNHEAKVYPDLPPPSKYVQFSSLEDKAAEVTLYFKPLPK